MRGFDPIAVVEAGYRAARADEEWYRAVADAVAPRAGRGLGAVAFRMSTVSGEPRDLVNLGAPPLVERAVLVVGGREDRRVAVRAVDPAGLYASSDVVGHDVCRWGTMHDALALTIPDGEGAQHVLAFPSPRLERVAPDERLAWRRLALHLGAGLRLRRQAGALDDPEVDAVLAPDGTLLEAKADRVDAHAREVLRAEARRIDRARSRRGRERGADALQLWSGLLLGTWSLVDWFDGDGRRFVVARRNDPEAPAPRALSRRQRQVVFYAALGLPNKQIAYALGLGETTVATHLANALVRLGLRRREDLVRLAAELARAGDELPPARAKN